MTARGPLELPRMCTLEAEPSTFSRNLATLFSALSSTSSRFVGGELLSVLSPPSLGLRQHVQPHRWFYQTFTGYMMRTLTMFPVNLGLD